MTEIIREIDEELQAKRYKELAKKYGKYVVGVVLLIALSFGGYAFLQDRKETQRNARASAFAVLASDEATPAESWVAFASGKKDGFAHVAWRFAVARYIEQGKIAEASEIMENLSKDDAYYSDFTASMTQILRLNNNQSPDPLLIDRDSAFSAFAILAEVERLLTIGDRKAAIAMLESTDTPIDSSLQTLFSELAEALKSEL